MDKEGKNELTNFKLGMQNEGQKSDFRIKELEVWEIIYKWDWKKLNWKKLNEIIESLKIIE